MEICYLKVNIMLKSTITGPKFDARLKQLHTVHIFQSIPKYLSLLCKTEIVF